PHVAHGEGARRAVEREAPRIAQPVRVDLGPAAAAAERVATRGPVAAGRVRVDAQQLAEQGAEVLPRARRIVLAAAVTHSDVEEAVGSELELTAVVVVELAVLDADHVARRSTQRAVRAGRAPELDHAD